MNEALFHSGIFNNTKVEIKWVDSKKIEDLKKCEKELNNCNGILVPGGFGKDGTLGKINAIKISKKFYSIFGNMFWYAISYFRIN